MPGYTRDELLGKTVKQISYPDDKNVTDDVRARMRSGEIGHFNMEKRYLRKDGSIVWVGLTISVERDADGNAEAIIAMGRTLSLTVVAEGVETPEQQEFLRAHGCDQMQGFYFSKPISADEFADLLRRFGSNAVHDPSPAWRGRVGLF